MLDIKKLSEEFTEVLNSISDEEFQEWYDSYTKRKALEEEKWAQMTVEERYSQIFASNCGIAMEIALSDGSLNGMPRNTTAKSKSTPVKKTIIAKPGGAKARVRNRAKATVSTI